jgi:hypothetical protein
MLGVYNRLAVSDERLRAVTNHIHDWLFKPSELPRLSVFSDPQDAPASAAIEHSVAS